MRKFSISLMAFTIAGVISSCVSTRVTSIKAPNHGQYSRVLIMAKFDYLELQNDYETDIQSALLEKGVFSVRGIDVFPPLRAYSDSAINRWIDSSKIDAVLVLTPQGVSTGTRSSLSQLTGTVNTHQTLDAVYSEASLIEPKSRQEMYRASLSSSLSEMASSDHARWSAAINLANDLQDNNFLVSTTKPVHHNHYVK